MPVDYSRWDSLTLDSSDEEDDLQQNCSRSAQRIVRVLDVDNADDGTQASCSSFEQRAKKNTLHQPCNHCDILFPKDVLKHCSRCRVNSYCSKDCQVKDWKSHKPKCTPHAKHDGHSQSYKAISNLFDIFTRYPSEKLLAQSSDAVGGSQLVLDIASIARVMHGKQGKGVLVMYFRNREECEDLAIECSLVLEGTKARRPPAPPFTYERWPLDRPGPRNASIIPLFKVLSIDSIMATVDNDKFALCLTIPESSENVKDGATQAMVIPYVNPSSSGLKKHLSAPLVASGSSNDFRNRLMNDDTFQECRNTMKLFKDGPGVLWLRNIFSFKNGFERNEVKKITPKVLQNALQLQIAANRSLTLGVPYSTRNAAAIFALHYGQSFTCTLVEEMFPAAVQTSFARDMADPNVLVGFFVTYSHHSSDSTVISYFKFSIKERGS